MAAKAKTLHDAFYETLKDVYYAEKQSVRALKKSAKAAEHALVPASEAAAKFPRLEANEAQAAIAALATAWNEKLASASPLHRQDSNNHGLGWVFGSLETMLRHSAEWHELLHATKR